MTSTRACFLFAGGLISGVALTVALMLVLPRALAGPAASGFPDVPAGHYAASSVRSLKAKGIVVGYPDGKYQGNLPVTRYEAAVALARFAQYYEKSHAPLSATTSALPGATPAPAGHWAKNAQDYLVANGFAQPISPLFKRPGNGAVTADEFADSSAVLLDHLSSRSLPPPAN